MLRSSVRWAAVLAVGALAVSACGPLQVGAAAIVGSGRISDATLAGQVASLNAGYQADPAKAQVRYAPSAMPRLALSWLLRFRIRDQLAAQAGISVTPYQEQLALAQVQASVSQSGGSFAAAVIGAGLPPDLLPALARFVAIQAALENRLDGGVRPTSQAAAAALASRFGHLECLAAKSLRIRVSPQYGALDYSQLVVVPVPSMLAAGPSGPVRLSSRQLTPPC